MCGHAQMFFPPPGMRWSATSWSCFSLTSTCRPASMPSITLICDSWLMTTTSTSHWSLWTTSVPRNWRWGSGLPYHVCIILCEQRLDTGPSDQRNLITGSNQIIIWYCAFTRTSEVISQHPIAAVTRSAISDYAFDRGTNEMFMGQICVFMVMKTAPLILWSPHIFRRNRMLS